MRGKYTESYRLLINAGFNYDFLINASGLSLTILAGDIQRKDSDIEFRPSLHKTNRRKVLRFVDWLILMGPKIARVLYRIYKSRFSYDLDKIFSDFEEMNRKKEQLEMDVEIRDREILTLKKKIIKLEYVIDPVIENGQMTLAHAARYVSEEMDAKFMPSMNRALADPIRYTVLTLESSV